MRYNNLWVHIKLLEIGRCTMVHSTACSIWSWGWWNTLQPASRQRDWWNLQNWFKISVVYVFWTRRMLYQKWEWIRCVCRHWVIIMACWHFGDSGVKWCLVQSVRIVNGWWECWVAIQACLGHADWTFVIEIWYNLFVDAKCEHAVFRTTCIVDEWVGGLSGSIGVI